MDLFTLSFAILVAKLTFCVVTLIVGGYLISANVEKKRRIKRTMKHNVHHRFGEFSTSTFGIFVHLAGVACFCVSGYGWWRFFIRHMID